MTDPTTRDPLEGIDIDDLPDDQRIAAATLVELRAVRTTIMDERRGRRLSIRLTGVAYGVVVLFIVGFLVNWRSDEARYSRVTCVERTARAQQIRDAIVTGVDAVAVYLEAEDHERAEVERVVDEAVRRELPPPDC